NAVSHFQRWTWHRRPPSDCGTRTFDVVGVGACFCCFAGGSACAAWISTCDVVMEEEEEEDVDFRFEPRALCASLMAVADAVTTTLASSSSAAKSLSSVINSRTRGGDDLARLPLGLSAGLASRSPVPDA